MKSARPSCGFEFVHSHCRGANVAFRLTVPCPQVAVDLDAKGCVTITKKDGEEVFTSGHMHTNHRVILVRA